MSTSYDIRIIYGFQVDEPVSRDRKTGREVCIADWLEHQEAREEIHRFNTGCSNGGNPIFFLGVELHSARDITRSFTPYIRLPSANIAVSSDLEVELARLRDMLHAVSAELVLSETGYYVLGDAA